MKINLSFPLFLAAALLLPSNALLANQDSCPTIKNELTLYRQNADIMFYAGTLFAALSAAGGFTFMKIFGPQNILEKWNTPAGIIPLGFLGMAAAILGYGAYEAGKARLLKDRPIMKLSESGIFYEKTFYEWSNIDTPLLVETCYGFEVIRRDLWFPIVGKVDTYLKTEDAELEAAGINARDIMAFVNRHKAVYVPTKESLENRLPLYWQKADSHTKTMLKEEDIESKQVYRYILSATDFEKQEVMWSVES